MAAVGHRETIDLGLDIRDGNSIGLEPGDVNLDIEVTDAKDCISTYSILAESSEATYLQTMASSGMTAK